MSTSAVSGGSLAVACPFRCDRPASARWIGNGAMRSGHYGAADGYAAMISRIQDTRFSTTRRRGYDERQIDEFLDLLVQILGARGSLVP